MKQETLRSPRCPFLLFLSALNVVRYTVGVPWPNDSELRESERTQNAKGPRQFERAFDSIRVGGRRRVTIDVPTLADVWRFRLEAWGCLVVPWEQVDEEADHSGDRSRVGGFAKRFDDVCLVVGLLDVNRWVNGAYGVVWLKSDWR